MHAVARFTFASLALVFLACGACGACGASNEGTTADASSPGPGAGADGGASPGADAAPVDGELGGDRPVEVHVPPGYVAGVAAPLVVLLHGYGASGLVQDIYFGLTALSDERGFLYVHPDGLVDRDGKRYWNATDACCDFGGTNVDDSTYLSSLITGIQARYTVDPRRIFLIGHSNGGFMSYRMACDHADQIAAIASLAGATLAGGACAPKSPVSILQIHGTDDGTVAYDGGKLPGKAAFPGARETVSAWAALDGCSPTADTSAPALDLDSKLAGTESTVTRYATGCRPGGHAELWTIQGGGHIPSISATFTRSVLDFLFAHPKP